MSATPRAALVYRSSPVSAPSRASETAATALAEGVAPSKTSLVRTMSSSASFPVVKKPPPSSSENRASSPSAAATARSLQAALPVSSPRRVKQSTSHA